MKNVIILVTGKGQIQIHGFMSWIWRRVHVICCPYMNRYM